VLREEPVQDGFDPGQLTGDASLNRLVIAGRPGVPATLAGRVAFDILSVDAIAALCEAEGVPVGLDSVADDLGAALGSADPTARRAGTRVVAEFGRRLACVLATLRDPGTPGAQGWNAWRHAYLRHWAAVEEVHLAGGLLAGPAGPAVLEGVRAALSGLGTTTRATLVPQPAWAALVGAARSLGVSDGDVVAVDLGGSRARTALVRAVAGRLDLVTVTAARVPFAATDRLSTEAIGRYLEEVLDSAAREARQHGASVRGVGISVACYLRNGRPDGDRGVYASLPDLRDSAWQQTLRSRFGSPIGLRLLHDGTAAAASVHTRGDVPSAVIVAGSALGLGFPPQSPRGDANLRWTAGGR
jgi:hypothetical protein